MEALLQLAHTLETFNKSQLSKQDYETLKKYGFTKSRKSVATAKAYVNGLIKSSGAINTTPAGKLKQKDEEKGDIIINGPEQLAHLLS
jgi:hypothetical protein